MTTRRLLFLILLMFVTVACTPMIYGVPEEQWRLMSEQERIHAMEAYKQRQIVLQQRLAERRRQQVAEQAQREALRREEMERRREKADAIYRGEAGHFGDLLQVSVTGGRMRLNGRHRDYDSVTFKIADGELKEILVPYSGGRRAPLYALYENGHLWLDTDALGVETRRAAHLAYSETWEEGEVIRSVDSRGRLDLRGVEVAVRPLPIPGRHRSPTVVVIEKPANPQVIIVKEKQAREKVVILRGESMDDSQGEKTAAKPQYKIRVSDGLVIAGKKKMAMVPVTILLGEGESIDTLVKGSNDAEVLLHMTLRNGRLSVDDGSSDPSKTFKISRQKGSKVFHLTTRGAVRLHNAKLYVSQTL